MVQTFTFIRPVQLLNFCSKSSLHCQRNLKLCFFFLSFKPHAANVPTYGVIGAKSYIHIHTTHLGSKRFHGSYHVWCRKFSSGDPMAVHARCGQWESRGDTMHLFVSFFFFPSFVPSVKDCRILTVIGTCTRLGSAQGRKQKTQPFCSLVTPQNLGTSCNCGSRVVIKMS